MRKKILFALTLVSVLLLGASCGDDDNETYDKVWKTFNESLIDSISTVSGYVEYESLTNNGSIYLKRYTAETTPFSQTVALPTTGQSPVFGDSVIVRYVGWYYNYARTPQIFDGTEAGPYKIDGVDKNLQFNRMTGLGFRIGNGIIDGWNTALYQMKEGDAVNIAIPYELGYKYTTSGSIPGFTTLWFDMLLVKVIKTNGE